MIYREEAKTKCPACQRTVAAVRKITRTRGQGLTGDAYASSAGHLVSYHLYQEHVELNEVGAPVKYTPGFCPGSMHPAKD